ncbi:hypothetical protein ACGFJ7_02560 [Actinoplanes sp. NPDC048988]|uniref:hypothetical protein n=1 Tax=Actinoplanes sp. NPDC048988 TaxID=3363901 RepID=UPI00371D343B
MADVRPLGDVVVCALGSSDVMADVRPLGDVVVCALGSSDVMAAVRPLGDVVACSLGSSDVMAGALGEFAAGGRVGDVAAAVARIEVTTGA